MLLLSIIEPHPLILSRHRRFILFRITAFGDIFFETTQAAFGPLSPSGMENSAKEKYAPWRRCDFTFESRTNSACETRKIFCIIRKVAHAPSFGGGEELLDRFLLLFESESRVF